MLQTYRIEGAFTRGASMKTKIFAAAVADFKSALFAVFCGGCSETEVSEQLHYTS
jgi:hypothetical protein